MNFKGIKQLLLFLLLVMSSSSTSNLSEDEENKFNFVVQLMCIDHICVFVCLRYPQSFQSNKTQICSQGSIYFKINQTIQKELCLYLHDNNKTNKKCYTFLNPQKFFKIGCIFAVCIKDPISPCVREKLYGLPCFLRSWSFCR